MKTARMVLLLFVLGALLCAGHSVAKILGAGKKNLVPGSRSGIWGKYYYVDEDGLPAEEWHVRNVRPFLGRYFDKAADNELMYACLFLDQGRVSLRLVEHGRGVVKTPLLLPSLMKRCWRARTERSGPFPAKCAAAGT